MAFRLFGMPFLCDQSNTDGAHDPRIGGTDHFFAQIFFHGSKNGVILKGSPLDHDLVAQGIHIGYADHFRKYIFYDGTAQPGHDVLGLLAVSLFGDDAAVHKYRAPASKGGRMF